jgi:DNA-binding HxlR family transcriptional regulator
MEDCNSVCEVKIQECARILHPTWTPAILNVLQSGPHRFNELKCKLTDVTNPERSISSKVLIERLQTLEREGVVQRVTPAKGAIMSYALTDWGYQSHEALEALAHWVGQRPAAVHS